jgi:hypothetical protein
VEWRAAEETVFKRIVRSTPLYGISVGVVSRLYRWIVLSLLVPHGDTLILFEMGFGIALLCALCAAHLANYPLPHWRWRAPALGAFAALGESATSLVLTLAHEERLIRLTATLADWPGTALNILLTRTLLISLFALVLSGVVLALRKTVTNTE